MARAMFRLGEFNSASNGGKEPLRSDRSFLSRSLGWLIALDVSGGLAAAACPGGAPPVSNIVDLRRDGDVAVVTVDNPPVNALKHAVRAGLNDALSRARDDAATRAIVLESAGRTFIAADITEFSKPPQPPSLPD